MSLPGAPGPSPANGRTYTLRSANLVSKWGFNDGDLDDALLDWLEEHGIRYRDVDDGEVLIWMVRTYLVPALEQDVELVEIETSHHPIRADRVDGVDVSEHWYSGRDTGPALTPDAVEVPYEDILRHVRETASGPIDQRS